MNPIALSTSVYDMIEEYRLKNEGLSEAIQGVGDAVEAWKTSCCVQGTFVESPPSVPSDLPLITCLRSALSKSRRVAKKRSGWKHSGPFLCPSVVSVLKHWPKQLKPKTGFYAAVQKHAPATEVSSRDFCRAFHLEGLL